MSTHSTPDTIILIHGFWVTPRSWENWIGRYTSRGLQVLAPAYPGFEIEVEALNADPTPIVQLKFPEIVAKVETLIRGLSKPPILIGHSAGGTVTQILLDRGLGAAGVAINSAPTEGVKVLPLSQLKAIFPVFKNPANRHRAVGLTYEQWRYAFTNTFSEEESRALYARYHIPASGGVLWSSVLANVLPGRHEAYVDYQNIHRAPLLFISGGADTLMPPSVQRANKKLYNTMVETDLKEYPGRAHLLPAQAGWEEVADYALAWALERAKPKTARAESSATAAQ